TDGNETLLLPYRAHRGSRPGARPSSWWCRVQRSAPWHCLAAVVCMGVADCIHGRHVEIPRAPDRRGGGVAFFFLRETRPAFFPPRKPRHSFFFGLRRGGTKPPP